MPKIINNEDLIINEGDIGAVYVRLSEIDKRRKNKNESINNQIELAKKWFKENNCKIYKIYIDEDVSGAKDEVTFERIIYKRKDYKELIEDAKKHCFSFVWVKDFARFGRKTNVKESNIESFNRLNIKVFSLTERDEDPVLRQVRGVLEEEGVRKQRKQISIYHKACLDKNKIISRPILGYQVQIVKKKSTGKWIINKAESKKVINIFEDFVYRKLSFKDLEKKYKITKIKRVLTNKKYLGLFDYSGTEIKLAIPLFLPSSLFNMANMRIKQLKSQQFNHNNFKKKLK